MRTLRSLVAVVLLGVAFVGVISPSSDDPVAAKGLELIATCPCNRRGEEQ